MGNVEGWITFVIIFSTLASFGYVFAYSFNSENVAREKALRAEQDAIHYMQDSRTGFCFATKFNSIGKSMSAVPCTPEVLDLIND